MDYNINNTVPNNLNLDTKEPLTSLYKEYSSKLLIAAYYSITISWYRESINAGKYIPFLFSKSRPVQLLKL